MWRQAVSRSPAFAWAASKTAGAVSSGDLIKLHRVRIKRRENLASRAVTWVFTASICYAVWASVAFLPLKNLDLDNLPKQEDEDDAEPLFLPFPFTVKQVQPLPYAGLEEEWQGFIKFSGDEKRRKRVKDELNMLVKKAAENNPYTKKWAEKGRGFQLGTSWLIISFPEKPPPEFVRWGLELGEDGPVIKSKKIDARTKALLDRVIAPYPVASASYAFIKAMAKQNASEVAQYLGYSAGGKEINTSSPNTDIEKTIKKLEARQTAHGGTASSTSSSAVATSSSAAEPPSGSRTSQQTAKTGTTSAPGGSKDSDKSRVKDAIPYHTTWVNEASGPWAAFEETYKRTWKPLRYYPPRGSLAVHGMVALDSPKGRVFIDVFAWYHPKEDKFHEDSLTMSLRSVSPVSQRPRR